MTLEQAAYRVRYRYSADGLTVENLADVERTFRVDASALFPVRCRLARDPRPGGHRSPSSRATAPRR